MNAKEIRELFMLFSEITTRPTERYTHEVYDQIRMENNSMVKFIHFVKMHYPEAIAEYDALNKIAES